MPDSNRSVTPYGGGVFQGLTNRIKLILRLMADKRVSPLIKLLPMTSVVYLFFPDIMPGPIDDAAIIWLSTYLFVELCPPDVVQEHQNALEREQPGIWRDENEPSKDVIRDEDVIEGEYREDSK